MKARQITYFLTLSIKAHTPSRKIRRSERLPLIYAALSAGVTWACFGAPQPVQDMLRTLHTPAQLEKPVAVLRIPTTFNEAPRESTAEALSLLNGLPVLDLTGTVAQASKLERLSSTQWMTLHPFWDGVTRTIVYPEGSPVRAFSTELRLSPLDHAYDIRSITPPPELHLDHLDGLGDPQERFSGVVVAYEAHWTQDSVVTLSERQDHATLIAGFFSHPRSQAPGRSITAVLGFLLSLSLITIQRTFGGPSAGIAGAAVLAILAATSLPLPLLLLGLASSLSVVATRFHQQALATPPSSPEDHLPPYLLPTEADSWQALCDTATHFGGALAAWAFTHQQSAWNQVAASGDATEFDIDQFQRLRAPLSARKPEDRAYLALPVPGPRDPLGYLILQPKDGQVSDPLLAVGGAMKLAADQIQVRARSEFELRIHGQVRALRAHAGVRSQLRTGALYDALGQVVFASEKIRQLLGSDFDPTAPLASTWSRLGGQPNPLPVAGDSGGCLVTHRGLKIRLETGVHVDTIECYTLHVVNQDTNLEGTP